MTKEERKQQHRKIIGIGEVLKEVDDLYSSVGRAEYQRGVIGKDARWEIEAHLDAIKALLRNERSAGKL